MVLVTVIVTTSILLARTMIREIRNTPHRIKSIFIFVVFERGMDKMRRNEGQLPGRWGGNKSGRKGVSLILEWRNYTLWLFVGFVWLA